MAWSLEGDRVRIEMTREEYNVLMMTLGYGIGSETDPRLRRMFLRLANSINEGNPGLHALRGRLRNPH